MGGYQAVESHYDIQFRQQGRDKTSGSGAFGEVRPCTHSSTHKLRAVKRIPKTGWRTRWRVLEEIRVLEAISGRHPNVIQFVEYFEEWDTMSLIFEFCPNGSVEDALVNKSLRSSEGVVAPLFWQLIGALAFLREEGILHRDVKPANLLLKDVAKLKLADFGTACTHSAPLRVCEGTPAYFAPEQHQLPRGEGYSFPVDMWAAGISLYMMLFEGEHPFMQEHCLDRQRLKGADYDVGWLISSRASDLLWWLLMPYPPYRIGPADAKCHQWFAAQGLGDGSFAKARPRKLALDNHGNWIPVRG